MSNELLNINVQKISITPGLIEFDGYEELKNQAVELAENIRGVEVNEDNIKVSKKLLAAVNKRVKELEDHRIQVKKSFSEPYQQFENQVKEIVNIVKEADSAVREQVRVLEELEREEKRQALKDLFEKRVKLYELKDLFTFDDFVKPAHLNKTKSINAIEAELVDWLESIENDLDVISTLSNGDEVLLEYKEVKNLGTAIALINDRERRKREAVSFMKGDDTQAESEWNSFIITLFDEKDVKLVKMFMDHEGIEYK